MTRDEGGFRVVQRTAPHPQIERPIGKTGHRVFTREYLIAELRIWAETHDGGPPRNADWNRGKARRRGIRFEEGWPSTQAVIIHFGSWRAGIKAAGLVPRESGTQPRYPPECSICGREAHGHGRRCRRCSSYLRRNGVEWSAERAAAGRMRVGRQRHEEFMTRARNAIALREQGLTNCEIDARLDLPRNTTSGVLSRAKLQGLEIPPSPYRQRGQR